MRKALCIQSFRRWHILLVTLLLLSGAVAAAETNELSAAAEGTGIEPLEGLAEIYLFAHHFSGDTVEGTVKGRRVDVDFDDGAIIGAGVGGRGRYVGIGCELFLGPLNWDAQTEAGLSSDDIAIMYGFDVNASVLLRKQGVSPVMALCAGMVGLWGDTGDYLEDDIDISYGALAGFRWTMDDGVFIEAAYKWRWTEVADTNDATQFDGLRLSIGLSAVPGTGR